ncbi:MAG TPA: LysR family transcriptional regulator [Kofleriaceae bacterium]|nr:LysR family transcriptional regulator [Kofleriaceae bacterium]
MLNYNHLYYFHVAAQEGSVGAAAAKLGVTQPTVSEQLRSLERSLGQTLFERSPMGLKLSEPGRVAFERTSVMFRECDRLIHDLDKTAHVEKRQLRVGISGTVARSTSGRFLMPLMKVDCIPVIRLVDCVDLLRGLRAGQLDLVLCENPPPESERAELDVKLVERTQLVIVAHPKKQVGGDWSEVSLVQYSTGSRFRWDIDAFLASRGLKPTIAAEADDALFLLEAAATGDHVAIVPAAIARDAIRDGRVKMLETLDTEHAGIYAIYRSSAATELAKRAIDVLVENR